MVHELKRRAKSFYYDLGKKFDHKYFSSRFILNWQRWDSEKYLEGILLTVLTIGIEKFFTDPILFSRFTTVFKSNSKNSMTSMKTEYMQKLRQTVLIKAQIEG